MEFLKEILGAELFAQVEEKINAHNGNEANKEKQVKIGNLGSGEYVGKLKYDDIVQQLTGKQTELDTANNLIAELKKGTKGNEELQGKITAYDQQVVELQKQLQEEKIKSAAKVGFLEAKALEIDYLTYKLNEKLKAEGKTLELDENEKIKGWDDMLSGLKTQFPRMFESASNNGNPGVKIEENPLPGRKEEGGMTRAELLRKPYAERAAYAKENPEAYNNIMNR